jgi:hypothetical protein
VEKAKRASEDLVKNMVSTVWVGSWSHKSSVSALRRSWTIGRLDRERGREEKLSWQLGFSLYPNPNSPSPSPLPQTDPRPK